jgi:hypothetical protein
METTTQKILGGISAAIGEWHRRWRSPLVYPSYQVVNIRLSTAKPVVVHIGSIFTIIGRVQQKFNIQRIQIPISIQIPTDEQILAAIVLQAADSVRRRINAAIGVREWGCRPAGKEVILEKRDVCKGTGYSIIVKVSCILTVEWRTVSQIR